MVTFVQTGVDSHCDSPEPSLIIRVAAYVKVPDVAK
jgi:hypothetical protein